MNIISVRAARSKGYLTLTLKTEDCEKKSLTVSEEDYSAASSPMRGDEIGMREYLILEASDEYYRARLSALRILSYADNNEKTIVRKLVAKGISYDRAASVAREMVSLGYVDERKQLLSLVLSEANTKLSGPRKIRAKLLSKGYKMADINSAIDTLSETAEIDFERSAQLFLEKKLTRGATDEEKKSLLYRNGYDVC